MTEFFDFILWMLESFVGFLMALPFMPEFTFGEVLIGIALMAVLISALVSSIRVANLNPEARQANLNDRMEGGNNG